MKDDPRQRELRRLAAGSLLLAALVALAWSPLPEVLLGQRLKAGNSLRPAVGRAHERAGLADEGRESADELGRDVEGRRRASAEAVSLPSLGRLLDRFGELTLSRREFLEFYASLDEAQRDAFASADRLWRWVEEDGLLEVEIVRLDGRGRRLKVSYLDGRRNRLAESRLDLDALLLERLGFRRLAEDDSLLVPGDPGIVAWSLPEWLALRADGSPPQGLVELLLLPDCRVDRVYEDGRRGLWVDLFSGGRHLLLELESEPDAPDGIVEDGNEAPADSASATRDDSERRKGRWFGF